MVGVIESCSEVTLYLNHCSGIDRILLKGTIFLLCICLVSTRFFLFIQLIKEFTKGWLDVTLRHFCKGNDHFKQGFLDPGRREGSIKVLTKVFVLLLQKGMMARGNQHLPMWNLVRL